MLNSYESATIDGRIELVAVDDHGWRISDRQFPENDARRVLGYVERAGRRYELLWLRFRPGRCDTYDGIALVLAAVIERMQHRMDAAA